MKHKGYCVSHKIGSKVYFYEFGHTGDKLIGVVTGVKENFDGSYTLEVKTHKYGTSCISESGKGVLTKTWEMSSDFAYSIKG